LAAKVGEQTLGQRKVVARPQARGGLRTHAYWLEIDISSCYLDDLERQELEKMEISGDRGLETMAELIIAGRKSLHTSKEVPNMLSLTKDI